MGGIVVLIVYILLGIAASAVLFADCRMLKQIWLGGVIGMMLLMWSHVPFSFFMGFTVASHLCGFLLAAAIVAALILLKKRFLAKQPAVLMEETAKEYIAEDAENSETQASRRPARGTAAARIRAAVRARLFPLSNNEILMIVSAAALMVISVILLLNHTIPEINGHYYTGQCTYGDMNMHFAFITSIAKQGMFPPTYSIMAGEPLNYPFLCDSISSSLMIFGSGLRTAYMAPMIFAFLWVYIGFWYIAEAILERAGKVWLAFTLFFLNGGFGIMYFLDNLKGEDKSNFKRIFTSFYKTPTNLVNDVEEVIGASGKPVQINTYTNIRWTNVIADMLLPQRATLFGWMCLFVVLYLLYAAVFQKKKSYFVIAGVLGGLLPIVHTHSFFAFGLIAVCWCVYSCIRDRFRKEIVFSWLGFGIPALLLSVPQLLKWTFNAVGESFVRYTFNWANSNGTDTWLWFWVKNVGIVLILLPVAFLHADRKKKIMYSGALLIFIVSEFIVFQPNTYDNIKLFFIWYVYTVILVADLLTDCFAKLKGIRGRSVIAVILIFVMTVSGALTIVREVISGTFDKEKGEGYAYQLYTSRHVESAKFIEENTEPDAVFLCYNNHNNAIAALTGRNIYCGAGTFLYYHGVGYQERERLMRRMLTDAEAFEENKESAGIDYVYIGDWERGNFGGKLIESYLDSNYKLIYSQDGVKIFDVRS